MEKEQAELQGLFKPVPQSQKISAGADPKSVLCLFFKQGACTKGDKCKFSHDMSLENKAEKRSMYVDARDSQDLKEGKGWSKFRLFGILVLSAQEFGKGHHRHFD